MLLGLVGGDYHQGDLVAGTSLESLLAEGRQHSLTKKKERRSS